MAHHRVGGEQGVLVVAEVRQTVSDEVAERGKRFAPGRGKASGAVPAHEGDVTVTLPAVEVVADLLVDGVLTRLPGAADTEGFPSARRGFAVLVVKVPAPAGRLVTVHQQVVAFAHPAVETLQAQAPPGAAAGPLREVVVAHQEALRRQDLHALQSTGEVPRPT